MTGAVLQSVPLLAARVAGKSKVHFVSGREAILRLGEPLIEFSKRCGQAGAMHDVGYFLSKPGAMQRNPHLLLVSASGEVNLEDPDLDDLLGLLLIFEHRLSGFAAGAYATNDRSGRGTLVAMPSYGSHVAAVATRALLDRGAHLILMSIRAADLATASPPLKGPLLTTSGGGKGVARWASRERSIPGYLPLLATFDETLAKIGQRTRRNLRYYRRRAESELGCTFLPEIEVLREDVLTFNRECMYAPSQEVAGRRYDLLQELSHPVLMGIKDRDGRWLSMLGGRRYKGRSEILWQMNRDGLPSYSLTTVMRSYFIEHEIAQGSRRMYIEGGTPQSIKFSFVNEDLIDLVVVRRSVRARAMRMVAQRYISQENELSHMLSAQGLQWMPC